jgi:methionyl-tRNA formyltransferase
MIERTISKIADNKEELIEQDKTKVTRYYKRKPEDGKIELSWPAIKVNDYVRALTHPYPGAFIESNFGQLFLWDVSIDSCKIHGNPGLVYQIHDGRGMLVKVGGFMCVWLKRVSHNGIEQWADEWARDMGIREGDNLIER